jgi:adenine-specific DNA methylase
MDSDAADDPVTVLILKDVLDGIEEFFGKEGVEQVAAFAMLKNRARESNKLMDELERAYGLTSISTGHGAPLPKGSE